MRVLPVVLGLAACAGPADPRTPQCGSLPSGTLQPDAGGPPTQIHGYGAPDARGAWVAWNRVRSGASDFDVWIAHLGCDGAVDVGPLVVADGVDNELDPAVAVREDGVLVAWQADVGGERNLRVRWRLLDPETGDPRGAASELEATGNAWMPAVAAAPEGFVLVAAVGGERVFEATRVRLDTDGAAGGPERLGGDPGEGDSFPDVAVADDGAVHVAWRRGESVWGWSGDGPAERLAADAFAPAVGAHGVQAWVGYVTRKGLRVGPAGEVAVLAVTDATPTGLAVAGTDDGAFVGWYGEGDGAFGSLHLGRTDASGGLVGQVELAASGVPAPYPLHVARAGPDHAFVVWQEGVGRDLALRAAFVEP